jgi:phenylalanyl-tRNA synthetase beta chain
MEHNIRLSERLSFFEIGKVYIPVEGAPRPNEPMRLVIGMTGLSERPVWDRKSDAHLDFYDLKGVVEGLLESIHIDPSLIAYVPGKNPSLHPGKCADILLDGEAVGCFGELHPLVKEQYEFVDSAILVAEIDLEKLIKAIPTLYESLPVPVFPAILEDLAIVVDEDVPAAKVVEVIQKAGGKLLSDVRLFDIFRGPQIGEGKKSLAYSLSYQAFDKTLTDKDAGKLRAKIIRLLEIELGAKLRS